MFDMKNISMENLLTEILNEKLKKLVLGNKRKKSAPVRKVVVRPVVIKGALLFQFEYHEENRVTHENLPRHEAQENILRLLNDDFKQCDIFTKTENIQVLASKPSNPRIKRTASSKNEPNKKASKKDFNEEAGMALLAHDRKKNYIIPEGVPCDFLIRLGVMDKDGRVFKKHYSKFRQINRYLEIVDDVFQKSCPSDTSLKVIDFGCGKAYLTFALYHYLHEIKGLQPEIIGLDLKENVIEFCNGIARDLGYSGLEFKLGDIADYRDTGCDMVVTLHACDTATDYALINAAAWNAPVILSVPCCQHELFKQIKNETLAPMLKHGIINDKFTELLTDGLRGLALEARGYDVQMIEFTTLEHTQKNIMIRAIKRPGYDDRAGDEKSKRALQEYNALKESFKVEPTIDALLR